MSFYIFIHIKISIVHFLTIQKGHLYLLLKCHKQKRRSSVTEKCIYSNNYRLFYCTTHSIESVIDQMECASGY